MPDAGKKPHWIVEHATKLVIGVIVTAIAGWIGLQFGSSLKVEPEINPITVIESATTRLYATQGDDFSLGERISGMSQLRLLADRRVALEHRRQAVALLTDYVKLNLPGRKRVAPELGITEDRGMFISQDIGDALSALQDLRATDPERIVVDLSGSDFSRMNIAYLDVSGFTFRFADFTDGALGPNLREVDFSFATFGNSAIWNSDLTGSNFHKSELASAKFMNPILADTNIEEAFGLDRMAILCNPTGLSDAQKARIKVKC